MCVPWGFIAFTNLKFRVPHPTCGIRSKGGAAVDADGQRAEGYHSGDLVHRSLILPLQGRRSGCRC